LHPQSTPKHPDPRGEKKLIRKEKKMKKREQKRKRRREEEKLLFFSNLHPLTCTLLSLASSIIRNPPLLHL